jgi:hypothetical protein
VEVYSLYDYQGQQKKNLFIHLCMVKQQLESNKKLQTLPCYALQLAKTQKLKIEEK